MIKVYRDQTNGLWIETRPDFVRIISELKIHGNITNEFIRVGGEWSFEEANATYQLWELS